MSRHDPRVILNPNKVVLHFTEVTPSWPKSSKKQTNQRAELKISTELAKRIPIYLIRRRRYGFDCGCLDCTFGTNDDAMTMVKEGVPPQIAKVAVERAKQIRDDVGMVKIVEEKSID